MKYYFIINPGSQSGGGKKLWNSQLRPCLTAHKAHWKAYLTKYKGHCTELTDKLTRNLTKPITLIILGGDGTLNEAINGLWHPELVTLGYIPTGSGNDFARGMKLKGRPVDRLHNILNQTHSIWLDCGIVKAPHQPAQKFLISSGIGYDALVTSKALDSKIKNVLNKAGLGRLTYALIGLIELLKFPTINATIVLDDKTVIHTKKFYFAASHNLPFEGGGFKFAPKAAPADGKLNLCLVHTLPRLKVLCLLPTAYLGMHTKFKGIENHQFRHMRIFVPTPAPVHTDGESYERQTVIDVSCEAGKIHFVY